MKMLNANLGVRLVEQEDPLQKVGSLYIPVGEVVNDYEEAIVVYPDADGEFKEGELLAFRGSGLKCKDFLIIQKHQILFTNGNKEPIC